MAEPISEAMALATVLLNLATDLEAGRSPNVDPATFRRTADLLAAKTFVRVGVDYPRALELMEQVYDAGRKGVGYLKQRRDLVGGGTDVPGPRRPCPECSNHQPDESSEQRKAREAQEANDGR